MSQVKAVLAGMAGDGDTGTRQWGFTLLEVLVAFVIAAIAIAALVQGAGGGLQNALVATQYQEGVARAQSRLALLDASLKPGTSSGDDGGGYTWRTSVTEAASTVRLATQETGVENKGGQVTARPQRTVLYDVSVTVAWDAAGRRREVRLDSRRLGVVAMAGP